MPITEIPEAVPLFSAHAYPEYAPDEYRRLLFNLWPGESFTYRGIGYRLTERDYVYNEYGPDEFNMRLERLNTGEQIESHMYLR